MKAMVSLTIRLQSTTRRKTTTGAPITTTAIHKPRPLPLSISQEEHTSSAHRSSCRIIRNVSVTRTTFPSSEAHQTSMASVFSTRIHILHTATAGTRIRTISGDMSGILSLILRIPQSMGQCTAYIGKWRKVHQSKMWLST